MRVPYGYLSRQYNKERAEHIWHHYVRPVVLRGDFTLGKEVGHFERRFAEMHKAQWCLGVGNGTDALEIALEIAEVDHEDLIAVPVNTFIATAASVQRTGGRIVFVDTNDKFVMDVEKIPDLDLVDAAVPVHFQGQPVDMKRLMVLSEEMCFPVIEDAAQAANASIDGVPCGTWGDFGCFSFHPQKNMNCWGDGGAVLFRDYGAYEKARLLRNHGMEDRDTYAFASRNSRLDTLHAAVLLHDIEYLKEHNDRRIEIAGRYDEELKDFLTPPPRDQGERHTYHLYMTTAGEPLRDMLLEHLLEKGVEAKVHYPVPLHLQPAFKHLGYKEGDFPVAELQAKEMISLPIHQFMTDDEVSYVIDTVKGFYDRI